MRVYYNEHDGFAAEWLRRLIAAGELPDGEVDERDISDVCPTELVGYTQCHFFAGLGGWARALRDAGWGGRPVWTGSCPCQPFSAAGGRNGFADERHLWPAWHWLIGESAPEWVFGEQVEGPDGLEWLDLVFSDLEAGGYACGAAVFPAAGVGAPHIRSRTYWVAYADEQGSRWRGIQRPGEGAGESAWAARQRSAGLRATGGLADAAGERQRSDRSRRDCGDGEQLVGARPRGDGADDGEAMRPGQVNGVWRAADWIFCRDGYWRPVEPGSEPLAHGVPGRVGRLRAYGNAVCLPQAAAFVSAVMEI